MKISILTLFPQMFEGPFDHSILKHAQEKKLLEIELVNIRSFGIGKHHQVDDTPYGGGRGMVMRVDVLHQAIEAAKNPMLQSDKQRVILLSADGERFTQKKAEEYAALTHIILLCGHYEGVDARIYRYVDEVVSLGDFVVTGGEIPSMLVTDAVSRLIPGVLKADVTKNESFSQLSTAGNATLLEYPQYTKPPVYGEETVPAVLLSGNHQSIETWRTQQAEEKTRIKRPDLMPNQRRTKKQH